MVETNEQTASDVIPNRNIYLPPECLIANEANEKARPSESADERRARVKDMAGSILANGQEYPVLVVEIDDKTDDGAEFVRYEYVDGGCRVDAIAQLNEQTAAGEGDPSTSGFLRKVWCSLVDPSSDLFRTAATANLHRTQNSILDMAHIVLEARERNGWKGRGSGQKISAYLGIGANRVSEYEKLLRAPASLTAAIKSGEIVSLDAALKLLSVDGAVEQERVGKRAAEIAQADQDRADAANAAKAAKDESSKGKGKSKGKSKGKAAKPGAGADDEPDKPTKPARVKAKHVAQAVREEGRSATRTKADAIQFFEAITPAAYPPAVVAFAEYFAGTWFAGKGTNKAAMALWDKMFSRKVVGKSTKKAVPAKKVAAKKKK